MSALISVNNLKKTMGSKLLFDGLSFGVTQREKLGLLGPNGAGKSTLLKILADLETPDEGEVSRTKGVRWAYVPQEEKFSGNTSVLDEVTRQLVDKGMEETEAQVESSVSLSMVGFENFDQQVSELSGGWRKRLSLAIAFAQDPDLLILDEPTNHLDWDGIFWLESRLKSFKNAFILVSHDRAFLNNLCNKTMEIHRLYKNGYLAFDCSYDRFLEKKKEYMESQLKLQDTMSNKARREVDWLRAGVKARTTKSRSRIKEAHALLDDLDDVKSRNKSATVKTRLEIDSGGRLSKKLFELKNVNIGYEGLSLIEDLDLLLGPKTCLGVLGENGSGKSSFLKVIARRADNFTGSMFVAENLRIVYFDQKREDLPQDISLIEYLGDGNDRTMFKGESVHVAAYAARFLFSSDRMQLKISQLSGGEQARLLIAKIFLQPADVLILDEPTNDLDIDSIEVLEETLSSFEGLILLVSHDRYFLDSLCDRHLALSGSGNWDVYADLNQWLKGKDEKNEVEVKPVVEKAKETKPKPKKLSYKEKRFLETIDNDIAAAEANLADAQKELENPDNFSDKEKMDQVLAEVSRCQAIVDDLYSTWEEIENKQ